MAEDITPELMKSIERDFNARVVSNQKIRGLINKARDGTATYADANKYAIEVGNCLAKTFKNKISSAVLPNGRMYYNIGSVLMQRALGNNYKMVSDYSVIVQDAINQASGINVKAKASKLNQERIDGIVNRLADEEVFDDVAWILDDPVINFTQSVATDTLKENAQFLDDAGIKSTITRVVVGKSCEWCEDKAGTYTYGDEPDDFYAQHENCRCMIIHEGFKFNRSRGSRMTTY